MPSAVQQQPESHRIYWQQWIAKNSGAASSEPRLSRRELITSSAAVRLSPAAKASDVTVLLRKTMQISDDFLEEDALVIVGTLYSLPRGYIQFSEGLVSDEKSARPRGDPFHVVKTIAPHESPLQMKENMQRFLDEQLARAISQTKEPQRSIISPKSQFYYIPSPNCGSIPFLIPNCIELDGYATDMETKQHEEEWAVDTPAKLYSEPTDVEIMAKLAQLYPWLAETETIPGLHLHDRMREQELLSTELRSSRALKSGFLLKRSQRDPNVWRHVQVILTPADLWFVSRTYVVAPYHGRIHLTRALLLQPSSDYLPLVKTPYAWEVVGGDGTSHLFRASCKQSQQEWMDAISEGIVNAYEASLFENAESRVTEEARARSQRAVSLVVAPFHKESTFSNNSRIQSVLRWGMEVVDYRELCRMHLAMTQDTLDTVSLQEAWRVAELLWFRATELVQTHTDRPHSHADTLCQHIDFMITGRRRKSLDVTAPQFTHQHKNQDTYPPIDLFDPLLAELQKLASLNS